MPGVVTLGVIGLAAVLLATHLLAVSLMHALRAYSRSRLEELCERRGHPQRADAIARDDSSAERVAELVAMLTAATLAAVAAIALTGLAPGWGVWLTVGAVFAVAGHVIAGVVGRAYAESIADSLWPLAVLVGPVFRPIVFVLRQMEAFLERRARRGAVLTARPQSVEVEIHTRSADLSPVVEPELSESTRLMLERAVALHDRDVATLMTPRSSMLALREDVALSEAAQAFVETGLSRIPLYGAHRDDIVGVLYVKDLISYLMDRDAAGEFQARKLARPALLFSETKIASELLEELRRQRVQMAIVVDEFGSLSGLITLEDLLEAIVGPIDDEHDTPTPDDPVVALGDERFEVDAAVTLEDLNDRLGLELPTDGDFQTVGGLAFDALGRVPEVGATFQSGGVEFTVLSVEDHAIRRLRIHLKPSSQAVA